MLKSIPPLLNPDLLFALASLGHGDELALVDANFPADRLAHRGGGRLRMGPQQAADLAGDLPAPARPDPQRIAQAPLRQPVSVMRRGVKVTATVFPGCIDQFARLPLRDRLVQIAQRSSTQPESGAIGAGLKARRWVGFATCLNG